MMQNDSYALPEQRPVFSQETAAPLVPQVGTTGGNINTGFQLRDTSKDGPSLMDTIVQLGIKYGNDKVAAWEAERKEAAFVEGMSRAAQGEAAADIDAARPWWDKMFGEGDVVAGARAWEGISDANQLEAAVMERMPQLRSLPPAEAAKAVLELRAQMQSKDPVRDQAQTAVFAKALPGILKTHAKEHEAYKQGVAMEAQRKGLQSSLDAYEQKVNAIISTGTSVRPEEASAIDDQLLEFFTPPAGVNPATHRAQQAEVLANALEAGQFRGYYLLRDRGKLAELEPALQRQLAARAAIAGAKMISERTPPEIRSQGTAIIRDEGLTPEQIRDGLVSVNAAARAATGIEAPLYTAQYIEQRAGVALTRAQREEVYAQRRAVIEAAQREKLDERQQAKLVKDMEAQEEAARVNSEMRNALLSNDPQSIRTLMKQEHLKPQQKAALNRAAAAMWNGEGLDPTHPQYDQQRLQSKALVLSKADMEVPEIRTQIKQALRSPKFTGDLRDLLQVFSALENDPSVKLESVLANYAPDKADQAKLSAFMDAAKALPARDSKEYETLLQAAWQEAEVVAMTRAAKTAPTKDAMKDIDSAVEAMTGDEWYAPMRSNSARNTVRALARAAYTPVSVTGRPGLQAVHAAMRNVDVFEDVAVIKNDGVGVTDLVGDVGKRPSFAQALRKRVSATGVDLDEALIYTVGDNAQNGHLFVLHRSPDTGQTTYRVVALRDIVADVAASTARTVPEPLAPIIAPQ